VSTILLIRHAETDLAGTFCGHTDPPLNEKGRNQLPTLLEALRLHKIDAVHTSDLQRARSTAQAIADQFVTKLHTDRNLREIHFGDWEALTWVQIEERNLPEAQRWLDQYPDLPAPNGESYEDFKTRAIKAFEDLLDSDASSTIAIVTHAGVLQLLLTTYCGFTTKQAWQETKSYCCVFELSRPA
jgi:alpha-ribazole phosphatase